MADWKTYAKAARNTARKQAPGAKRAVQREARAYAHGAQKVWDAKAADNVRRGAENAKNSASESAKTMRAAAKVAGRRYRRANMTKRLLAALRDTSIIAVSLGAIWFVFSRIIPIPVTWMLILLAVLVLLRIIAALMQDAYEETDPDDPEGIPDEDLPEGAKVKKFKS